MNTLTAGCSGSDVMGFIVTASQNISRRRAVMCGATSGGLLHCALVILTFTLEWGERSIEQPPASAEQSFKRWSTRRFIIMEKAPYKRS